MDDRKVKPKLTEDEKKLIADGKATIVEGKVVLSNVGKVEGRS